jgi:hypothetical protein
MRALGRTLVWSGVAVAIVGGATVVLGQSRADQADAGSLAALTSEIRELRLAVQQLAQTQTQTQALSVYLSVQQSRVLQTSAQLDAARKELDAAERRASEVSAGLAEIEEQLPRITDATERNAFQGASRDMKRQQAAASVQEQQARARELELSQALQSEESRWSTLLTRLEALVSR